MPSVFTPGYRNQIVLGSTLLPVLAGTRFSMPENMIIPQVFSGNNLYQYVYVPGLQYPTISLNTFVTKDWFTAVKLNAFFERVSDDVASAGALQYWDGYRGISVPICKVNTLSLGASLGDLVRCQIVLIGTGTVSELTSIPSSDYVDVNPTAFQHVAVGGDLSTAASAANALSSWDLVLSNNLDVCPDLNGTRNPTEVNSGQFTATLRIVQQAKATAVANGGDVVFTITPSGDGTPVGITAHNIVCMDREERTVQFPRQMRERNYVLLGNGAPNVMPITIA